MEVSRNEQRAVGYISRLTRLYISNAKPCMAGVRVCVCSEALRDMQAVAEHMNEMQKIYDEYGAVFDALSSDGTLLCRVNNNLAVNSVV